MEKTSIILDFFEEFRSGRISRVENAAVKLILGRCDIYHAVDIEIPKMRFYEFCV